jgi:hypothetical protein
LKCLRYLVNGAIRFNTSNNVTEIWSGTKWTNVTTQIYSIDYIITGGGGGGGSGYGPGGGGAGGLISAAGQSVIPGTNYSIVIGAGGNGGTSGSYSNQSGTNGSDTSAFSLTAIGGGGGGSGNSSDAYGYVIGKSGGSGGTTVATVTITYTDTNKTTLLSIAKT